MRILCLLLTLLICFSAYTPVKPSEAPSEISITENETEAPAVSEVTLMAAGDNLFHRNLCVIGRQSDGSYDYSCVYENVKDFIESFDISVINQETVFVEDEADISYYPLFGTPDAVGAELIKTGFDVILGATNHSYDKGKAGVLHTVEFWKSHPEVTYLGLHDSIEDYETIRITEKNGIKIALLNYTFYLNGLVIPDEYYYFADTLYDEEKVKQDLLYAEENADFTVVFPHWGVEYVYDETEEQQKWAEFFTQYGADLIIGAHPHVVEPVKKITSENGNSSVCYYSLGNFVSGQDRKPRMLGGLATVTIRKTTDGENIKTEIANSDFVPSVTHFNRSVHTVYLLKDYTDGLYMNSAMQASPDYLWELWEEINEDSECPYNVRNENKPSDVTEAA